MAEYINVLLVGRTGFGKSSTGNKLIQAAADTVTIPAGAGTTWSKLREWKSYYDSLRVTDSLLNFQVGHGAESCTKWCKILSSNTTRVIDTPGFGGTERSAGVDVKQANVYQIRRIIRLRDEFDMKIHRVVYFIPLRGVLRKADGTMREELETLQYYFGNAIFESMIIVATYDSEEEELQDRGFREKQLTDTNSTLVTLFNSMQNEQGEHPCTPPLIYLGLNDLPAMVYDKIMKAPIHTVQGLTPSIVRDTCIKCAKRVKYSAPRGKDPEPIEVTGCNGTHEPYSDSKCHPLILPKYTKIEKIIGGIVHVATLGIPYLVMDNPWPGFTNTDEECIQCKCPPGSNGCMVVENEYRDEKHVIIVRHCSEIEYIVTTAV